MDCEFIPLTSELTKHNITSNATSADEHVPKVECQIRVIKEQNRGLYHSLSYTTISKVMMRELVYYVIVWLNNFPLTGRVSSVISPCTLITGVRLDHNKHCKV